MTSLACQYRLPLFTLQLPQKTLGRFGLGNEQWEQLIEFMLDIKVSDASLTHTFIDFAVYRDILQLSMNLFGRDRLLRWYIADIRPQHLGPVGVAMGAAPTVAEALDLWLECAPVLMPTLAVAREDSAQEVRVAFRPLVDMGPVQDHYMELVLLLTAKLLTESGNGHPRAQLHVAHGAAYPPAFYQESFGIVPRFAATGYVLRLDRESLAIRNDEHMPLLYRQAHEGARLLVENARHQNSLVHAVRRLLLEDVSRGRFHSQEEMAERLNLSSRTLARRLREEDASFRDLQGEARLELAKQQLRQTGLPVKTICSNAGFTNLSAFSRAFRKYTQQTPSAYRQQGDGIVAPALDPPGTSLPARRH